MLLSSSWSVAFTLAIISPTGFFSVTLIVSKGNGLKKQNIVMKKCSKCKLHVYISSYDNLQRIFRICDDTTFTYQEFKNFKSIKMLRKSIFGTKLLNFFAYTLIFNHLLSDIMPDIEDIITSEIKTKNTDWNSALLLLQESNVVE